MQADAKRVDVKPSNEQRARINRVAWSRSQGIYERERDSLLASLIERLEAGRSPEEFFREIER